MKIILLPIITILILGFSTAYAHEYPDELIPDKNFIPEKNHISEAPNVITYGIISSPGPKDEARIIESIDRAFEIWEEHNPSLNFEKVDYFPDVKIQWNMDSTTPYTGYAVIPSIYQGVIVIQIGEYNCESEFVEYSSDSLTKTTMHEIGHILGLLHHTDENHLMYGNDEFTVETFDELGYNIPERLVRFQYFVGEKPLEDVLSMINQKRKDIDNSEEHYLLLIQDIVQEMLYCFSYNLHPDFVLDPSEGSPTPSSPPTNLSVESGDGFVTLSWTEPSDAGGSEITQYSVGYSDDGGNTWKGYNKSTSTTEITVTGLTNDTLYHFRVSAINGVGSSNHSNIVFTTPIEKKQPSINPLTPTNLSVESGDGYVTLSWTAIHDNSFEIIGYYVEYSNDGGNTWTYYDKNSRIPAITVTGLTNNIEYDFRVSLRSSNLGFSDPSNIVSATPQAN